MSVVIILIFFIEKDLILDVEYESTTRQAWYLYKMAPGKLHFNGISNNDH